MLVKKEFSLSPNDLNIVATMQLKEGNSTTGFAGLADGSTPTPGLSNQLIQKDQPFNVEFNWTENGSFVPFLGGGKWKLSIIFDTIGGVQPKLTPTLDKGTDGISGKSYKAVIDVKEDSLDPGTYRIVAKMQWHFKSGNPGPLVMFSDLGMIEVYQDS